MGRTYRYDADVGPKRTAKKPKTRKEKKSKKRNAPVGLSVEWAIERTYDRANWGLELMIEEGLFSPSDKEYYLGEIQKKIRAAAPKYSPVAENKDGKLVRVSQSHYALMVVDRALYTLRDHFKRGTNKLEFLPITDGMSVEESQTKGCVHVDELNDGGRSVKDLELKMDMKTLFSMLDPEERVTLRMRLEGYTMEEIGERLGCDRFRVMRTILPHIGEVARECGFFPASEVKSGEADRYFEKHVLKKAVHISPPPSV